MFAFPATLETFGIVRLEALADEEPLISANVRAAAELIGNGASILLAGCQRGSITTAVEMTLTSPAQTAALVAKGCSRVEQFCNLPDNSPRLAGWLVASRSTR